MFVSGVTIVRNAVKFDYPIVESIKSILPLVDEMVVLVGDSDDGTLDRIININDQKIKIHHSKWDPLRRTNGSVLADETNKALQLINPNSDWIFYLQADEIVHEKDLGSIKVAMEKMLHNNKVDGLLFNYLHFYGQYNYLAIGRNWYRKEIRLIKNKPNIYSYKDAQGFRIGKDQKLNVVNIDATIYHYGWVKSPKSQQAKQESFQKLWHNDQTVEKLVRKADSYDYSVIDLLKAYDGSHPLVMSERIQNSDWGFNWDPSKRKISSLDKLLMFFEKNTGYRLFEYKNFKLVSP